MNESTNSHEASLRRIHRIVLAALALGAVVVFTIEDAGGDAAPPQIFTLVALGFAVGSIIARRLSTSPMMQTGTRFFWATAALVLALGIAVTAVTLVALEAERQNGLLFLLGAGLLCLRPPTTLAPSRPRPTSLPKDS